MRANRNTLICKVYKESDKVTASGIILPKFGKFDSPTIVCNIISANHEDFKDGEDIFISKMCGSVMEHDKEYFLIVRPAEVFCKIENGELIPYKNRVILEQDQIMKQTNFGVHINLYENDSLRPKRGTILMKNEKVEDFEIGDRVFFSMYSGRNIEFKGKKMVLMSDNEIFGKIVDENAIIEVDETRDIYEMGENMKSSGVMG